MKQQQILLLCFLLMAGGIFSQTPNGPGGISNTTGSGSLRLWLDAGDVDGDGNYHNNPVNGTAITTWFDKSGYAYNLTNATAAFKPALNTGGTFPAVQFATPSSGSAEKYLSNATATTLNPGSIFIVLNAQSGGNVDNLMFDDGTTSLRFEQYSSTGIVGYTVYGVADYVSGIATPYSATAYSLVSYHRTNANSTLLLSVGSTTTSIAIGSASYNIPISRLGTTSTSSDRANSNMVEVVAHNVLVNNAQKLIIENELSAKYGSFTIPSDLYTMDNVGNGNYDNNVAGIGQAPDGSQQLDSRGTGIVEVFGATGLANNVFFMWGDDGGALVGSNTDIPATVASRLTRTWRVSNGGITSESMKFDLTGLGSVTTSDLRLLIDKNNNGLFSDETSAGGGIVSGFTFVSGTTYSVSGINIGDGLRFTLGTINYNTTPLPVGLVNFAATPDKNKVDLNWTTATETNNDYFTIEKSKNGVDFDFLDQVKSKALNGNSTAFLNYEIYDTSPYMQGTNYYRLKQTDRNGQYSYFNVVSADLEPAGSDFSFAIYPNPSLGGMLNLAITADKNQEVLVVVYDITGKENYSKVIVTEDTGENVYAFDSSGKLAAGVYFITATSQQKIISKKLIIK